MIKEFDPYDYLTEKLLFLRADKRLDLRIIIALVLKAAFFSLWYILVKDESKFTWVAIGMNLATWPIYHLFFFLAEFRYLTDGQIDHYARKSAFRITDQFQNFILLIEFCILILYYDYNSQFHKIVVALLVIDNIIFLLQNAINCYINRKSNSKTGTVKVSKIAKKTASQIIENMKEYKQVMCGQQFEYLSNTEEKIKNINEETLSQKIQVQIINETKNQSQKTKQDVAYKLCYDYNAKIYFEAPQNLQQQNQEFYFGKGDKKGLSAFYLMFFVGSMASMIALMIILFPIKAGLVITIFIILEVVGNFVIVCFGCLKCCDCGCFTGICQKSFSKLSLSLVEGLIFGITSVYYGIIFGSIVIIVYVGTVVLTKIGMTLGLTISAIQGCYKSFKRCILCYDNSCQKLAFWLCFCFCLSL